MAAMGPSSELSSLTFDRAPSLTVSAHAEAEEEEACIRPLERPLPGEKAQERSRKLLLEHSYS